MPVIDKDKFAKFLNEGITAGGNSYKSKKASVKDFEIYIYEETGLSVANIRKWKNPNTTPNNLDSVVVEKLAKIIIKNSSLERDWLKNFLQAAAFVESEIERIESEIFSTERRQGSQEVSTPLAPNTPEIEDQDSLTHNSGPEAVKESQSPFTSDKQEISTPIATDPLEIEDQDSLTHNSGPEAVKESQSPFTSDKQEISTPIATDPLEIEDQDSLTHNSGTIADKIPQPVASEPNDSLIEIPDNQEESTPNIKPEISEPLQPSIPEASIGSHDPPAPTKSIESFLEPLTEVLIYQGSKQQRQLNFSLILILLLFILVIFLLLIGFNRVFSFGENFGTPSIPNTIEATSISVKAPPTFIPTATPIIMVVTSTPSTTPTALPTASPTPTATPTTLSDLQISPKDKMSQLFVPAGEFLMGALDSDEQANEEERPRHPVFLDSYWIDKYEISNAQFTDFLNDIKNPQGCFNAQCYDFNDQKEDNHITVNNGYYVVSEEFANHPVTEVSWYGAAAYCQWAGRRLPTEAEWERAARFDNNSIFIWGDTFSGGFANYCDLGCEYQHRDISYNDTFTRTAPIDGFPEGVSPIGAYNMTGNAAEWVFDWWNGSDFYPSDRQINPQGDVSGIQKVYRGGAWNNSVKGIRISWRKSAPPTNTQNNIGFRCAESGSSNPTVFPTPAPWAQKPENYIYVAQDETSSWGIYLGHTENNDSQQLLLSNGIQETSNISWSPNQTQIAFDAISSNGLQAIYIMPFNEFQSINLSQATAIHTNTYKATAPVWSPQGDRLAFQGAVDNSENASWHIFTLNLLNGQIIQLTKDDNYHHEAPTWSPDGQQIAFSRREKKDGWASKIYYIDAINGSGLQPLTEFQDRPELHPSWSPTGNKIAFVSFQDENWEIFVADLSSSPLQIYRLTCHKTGDWNPEWSQDGNHVIFNSDRNGQGHQVYWTTLEQHCTNYPASVQQEDAPCPKSAWDNKLVCPEQLILSTTNNRNPDW